MVSESDKLIHRIDMLGYNKFGTLSDENFRNLAIPIRSQLMSNKSLAAAKSGGDEIPLEDIFYLYEGILNSVATMVSAPQDEDEVFESQLTVPIFEEEGNYYIEI